MKRTLNWKEFIENEEVGDELKGTAIHEFIISLPTHNSTNKDDLVLIIKYLHSLSFDVKEGGNKLNDLKN